jgi:hypothetical protein
MVQALDMEICNHDDFGEVDGPELQVLRRPTSRLRGNGTSQNAIMDMYAHERKKLNIM